MLEVTSVPQGPYRVCFRPDSADGKAMHEVFVKRAYRRPSLGFDVEPGDVWIDLGAHIGSFAVYAAARGATRVYAYEPEESNFALLERNVALNALPVTARRAAVVRGPRGDSVTLHVPTSAARNWRASVTPSRSTRPVAVPAVSLQQVLDACPDATAVKMDVEKAEVALLTDPLLDWRGVRKLVFEYTMRSFAIDEILTTLRSHGFSVQVPPWMRKRYLDKHGKVFTGMMDQLVWATR
jgi:FkbM family methyltransferase